MTLTEFLLARIADDEARAKAASDGDIARWTRVLAECEAKRRIVGGKDNGAALFAIHERGLWPDELTRWADEVLAALALPYMDHPDYQADWKP